MILRWRSTVVIARLQIQRATINGRIVGLWRQVPVAQGSWNLDEMLFQVLAVVERLLGEVRFATHREESPFSVPAEDHLLIGIEGGSVGPAPKNLAERIAIEVADQFPHHQSVRAGLAQAARSDLVRAV